MNNVNSSFQILTSISSPHINVLSRTFNMVMNSDIKSRYPCLVPDLKYMNVKNFNCFVVFSSVQSLSRIRLCNPMGCSTPGLPVHHQLPESTQTHVHWVADAIQPSHPLPSPSPPAINPSGSFQMSQFFISGCQSIGVSASISVLPMNTQDWSPLGWTGWISLQSKGLSKVFSNTTVQKHQFFDAQLSL